MYMRIQSDQNHGVKKISVFLTDFKQLSNAYTRLSLFFTSILAIRRELHMLLSII